MANPGMRHAKKSTKPDPVDTSLVGATNWNDRHYFLEDDGSTASGALGDLPYRGASGLVTLLTGAQGVLTSAGSGSVPAWSMTPTLTGLTVTTITIGAVTIDATDAGYIDGLTPGTVTASKALVVDSNKDLATLRHLTISGNLVTGSTTLSETDLAKIDAITNGTASASKALVLDANLDISGIRNNTLIGTLRAQNGGVSSTLSIMMGADSGASTLTDATAKIGRMATPHYTNAEEPMALLVGDASSSDNILRIGGGSSVMNAATIIGFYTAANTTTTTGTLRWSIQSNGNLLPGTDNSFDLGGGSFRVKDGYYAGFVSIGSNVAATGQLRLPHAGLIAARNNANNANRAVIDFGGNATDLLVIGSVNATTALRSDLATPGALVDGQWWVECTGASPSRVCAIKVRDGGATRTIASVTY